tara:strand:+ start:220 stop:405 length:186 start_codon:yes stop_codon:yes gene_type:complete
MRTRYIPDLPSYTLEQLMVLYHDIIDSLSTPDFEHAPYTPGQLSFVKKLIEQKGGTIPEVA